MIGWVNPSNSASYGSIGIVYPGRTGPSCYGMISRWSIKISEPCRQRVTDLPIDFEVGPERRHVAMGPRQRNQENAVSRVTSPTREYGRAWLHCPTNSISTAKGISVSAQSWGPRLVALGLKT